MSDYTSTFTESTGDTIDTTDFSTEFDAIATASATKQDSNAALVGHLGGATIAGTVSSAPGTATVDFTGIPSWVNRVTIVFDNLGMSANTGVLELQLGVAAGIDTTADYSWQYNWITSAGVADQTSNSTFSRFRMSASNTAATDIFTGHVVISNITGNVWVISGVIGNIGRSGVCSGRKALSDTLTQLRILNSSANTFDTGSINIMYEG